MGEQRLILSTDLSLSAARILLAYDKRWSIEDLFNQLKNRWGWKDAWRQSRQEEQVNMLAATAPWRAKQPVTAGRVRLGLARIFRNVDVRSLWRPKSGKFGPNSRTQYVDPPPPLRKAA